MLITVSLAGLLIQMACGAPAPSAPTLQEDRGERASTHGAPFDVGAVIRQLHSPQGEVDPHVLAPAGSGQASPAIAFGGGVYLAVWQDGRRYSSSKIWGARVSASGALLDPAGFLISPASGWAYDQPPAVAYGGGVFLVAWGTNSGGIYYTRVSPSGTILDPSGRALNSFPNAKNPCVAFDGGAFAVAWEDAPTSDYNIYAARIGTNGTIKKNSIAISTASGDQRDPAIAYDGTNFSIVWDDTRNIATTGADIYGARLSTKGTVLDPSGFAISTASGYQLYPTLAFGASTYTAAWQDYRTSAATSVDIYARRFSTSGAPMGSEIPVSTAPMGQSSPALVFGGTHFHIAWRDSTSGQAGVYSARLTTSGAVLDPGGVRITSVGDVPALAFDGAMNLLYAWEDRRFSSSNVNIYGARTSLAPPPDPPDLLISQSGNEQLSPAIAFNGTDYLVTWMDARTGVRGVWGRRMDAGGTPIGSSVPLPIFLSGAGILGEIEIAYGGGRYMACGLGWLPGDGNIRVICARIDAATLEVIDTTPIVPSPTTADPRSPAVASDGTDFLVAWHRASTNPAPTEAMRISGATGALIDTQPFVVTSNGMDPAVAFDGVNYLVAYSTPIQSPYPPRDIAATFVSPAGTVLTPGGFSITASAVGDDEPQLAFDGTRYLVTWHTYVGGNGVYGARVAPTLVNPLLDTTPIAISNPGYEAYWPRVAYNGTDFFVIWEAAGDGQVMGRYVSGAGQTLGSPFIIADGIGAEVPGGRVASTGAGGSAMVVYYTFDPDPSVNVQRARLKTVHE